MEQSPSLVGKPQRRNNLEDLVVDRRIILKYILEKWLGRKGLDAYGSG
jgi:hypothetical protein